MTTTKNHPVLNTTDDADRFRECEGWMRVAMRDQIGMGNLMAISGLRVTPVQYGIELPVAKGYRVQVLLAGNDTYTVRRVRTVKPRGELLPVTRLYGERTEVYCEQLGNVARMAGSFESYDADEWPTKA